MTPTPALLRGLVATNALLFLLVFGATVTFAMIYAEVGETLGMQEPSVGASDILAFFAVMTIVPAHLASLLGLYLLKDWGRWLYLATLIVVNSLSLLTSLSDVSMTWGFPIAVAQVEAIVSGVILGIAFFSPIARQFPVNAQAEDQ